MLLPVCCGVMVVNVVLEFMVRLSRLHHGQTVDKVQRALRLLRCKTRVRLRSHTPLSKTAHTLRLRLDVRSIQTELTVRPSHPVSSRPVFQVVVECQIDTYPRNVVGP